MKIRTRQLESSRYDWGIAAFFFVAALAIRLPNFMQTPRFADEGLEVLWGLDIASGKHLPLTGFPPHYGPLFAYLMALLFRVVGIHLELARLVATIFGSLAVAATFLLGRATWNRAAGIIAASFALTSPDLIVYGSHNGWSASLTPFFVTATLVTLYTGIIKKIDGLVILSGALAALAVQTHPTSLVVLAGIALWFFRLPDWKTRLRHRAVWISMLLFVICYSPMLITLTALLNPSNPASAYVSEFISPALSINVYLPRLAELLKLGGYYFGGGIGAATPFLRAETIFVQVLLIAGLIWTWHLGVEIIPLTLVTSVLLLPAVLGELSERYYLYLFPIGYVAIGIVLTEGARWARAKLEEKPLGRMVSQIGLPMLIAALVLATQSTLSAHYARVYAEGGTNQEYFRFLNVIRENHACNEPLLVERAPKDFSTPASGQAWYSLNTMDYLLALEPCLHIMTSSEELALAKPLGYVVISEPSIARLAEASRFVIVEQFNPPLVESQAVPILLLQAMR